MSCILFHVSCFDRFVIFQPRPIELASNADLGQVERVDFKFVPKCSINDWQVDNLSLKFGKTN